MTVPMALRAGVLALLVAAFGVAGAAPPPAGGPAAAWLRAPEHAAARADSLLLAAAPAAVVRATDGAPSTGELDVLAAAGRRAPLFAALPAGVAYVAADAPARPRTGRAAAVSFRLRGAPGDSLTVRLADETGVLDSARVRLGPDGAAGGAFRVRPPRGGWREWTVAAGEASARTGAWVDSAGPPRVLVRAGMPHWEANFIVRALEESGAHVDAPLSLGRDLVVEQGGGTAITPDRLAAYDAVLVLDGAPLAEAERRALAGWAESRGGGVLLTGAHAGDPAFGLAADIRGPVSVDGRTVRWSLPAELASLPEASVRASSVGLGPARDGAFTAAETPAGAVVLLRPLGRGRAAAVGFTETWRWRMEAGRVAEHREFWRSLTDWLAADAAAGFVVRVPEPSGESGVPREILVHGGSDADGGPPPLEVRRPGGAVDTVPLVPDPSRAGVYRAVVVPADTGVHLLALAGEGPTAGFRADTATLPAADGWGRLALIAHASGGRMVPADSLRQVVAAAVPAAAEGGRFRLGWLLFGALVLLAGTEWLLRRLRGLA